MHSLWTFVSETVGQAYPDFTGKVKLSPPPKWQNGDYCFNVWDIARQFSLKWSEIAHTLSDSIGSHSDVVRYIEVMGIYVNLCLTDKAFLGLLAESRKTKPAESTGAQEWSVIVDYIGINIGKPLHIGHICTPSIGQVFCNIYRYKWRKVIGDVHTGDWGGIFGRLIAWWKRWGDEMEFQKNPVRHLLSLYQMVSSQIEPGEWVEPDGDLNNLCREEFRKLSSGDEESIRLWGRFTSESLTKMEETLWLLNVRPDVAIGESFYEWLPLPKLGEYPDLIFTMGNVVEELIFAGIAQRSQDGSVGVSFPEGSKLPSNILQKKDGTHGYFASDLACIKYRLMNGWNPSKIIYCTDMRQALHFKQVFAVARMAWWVSGEIELVHAPNGFISLPEWAMSTRKWNVVWLDDLFDEAFTRTRAILEEKSRTLSDEDTRSIAIGWLKYSYLMRDREGNVIFNWDNALNLEGRSGPYIQYAYVRSKKLNAQLAIDPNEAKEIPMSEVGLTEQDKTLIKVLIRMDEAIDEVIKTHKPHHLALYCYDLATTFNSFYALSPTIVGETNPDIKFIRSVLSKMTEEKLRLWFELLGINMPSEM